ncbi:hypothetical protein Tco_0688046 [Tanacetum coccineum]
MDVDTPTVHKDSSSIRFSWESSAVIPGVTFDPFKRRTLPHGLQDHYGGISSLLRPVGLVLYDHPSPPTLTHSRSWLSLRAIVKVHGVLRASRWSLLFDKEFATLGLVRS